MTLTETADADSNEGATPPHRWSWPTLFAFRFGTCYFGGFGIAVAIGLIPILAAGLGFDGVWPAMAGMLDALHAPIAWIGAHLLGLDVVSTQVGSDSAFQWVTIFVLAAVSLVATIVWSVLDRRRDRYDRCYAWVTMFLRLLLATAMFYFGMAKVIPTQMPFLLNRLVEPFGNFSPAGVLWAQVGISPVYEILLGVAEVVGGLLLLTARTAPAGALLCTINLTQVFILNMTYDVRLKTVSSQLLLMSVFLLAPHLRRLAAVLLSASKVPTIQQVPLFDDRRRNRVAQAGQVAVGLVLLAVFGLQGWQQHNHPNPTLHGIWEVTGFSAEGYARDPLLTDELRWRRVVFDRPFQISDPVMLTVQHMDDSFEVFGGTIDPRRHFIDLHHRIDLGTFVETPVTIRLTYWWPGGPDRMIIDADDYGGRLLHVSFRRVDTASFPLVGRGFNLVQEHPYNR